MKVSRLRRKVERTDDVMKVGKSRQDAIRGLHMLSVTIKFEQAL